MSRNIKKKYSEIFMHRVLKVFFFNFLVVTLTGGRRDAAAMSEVTCVRKSWSLLVSFSISAVHFKASSMAIFRSSIFFSKSCQRLANTFTSFSFSGAFNFEASDCNWAKRSFRRLNSLSSASTCWRWGSRIAGSAEIFPKTRVWKSGQISDH